MTPEQREVYDGAIRMLDSGMWHEGGWNIRALGNAMCDQVRESGAEPSPEWLADHDLVLQAHRRAVALQCDAMRIGMGLEPVFAQRSKSALGGFFRWFLGK